MKTRRQYLHLFAVAAALAPETTAFAGKVPLRPDELLAQSQLIVVGQVESHRDEERSHDNGSKSRAVFLTVRVESVEKGNELVKPDDRIVAGLWVVVKEPRQGVLWDSGHWGIPGDGGRAKFFLDSRSGEAWNVIYPNGFERLDEIPTLQYSLEPPDRRDWRRDAGIIALGAAVVAFLIWQIRRLVIRRSAFRSQAIP
jgi:hypothetical protein